MGYILVGLSANSFLGVRATVVYLIGYLLMNLGFFVLLLSLTNIILHKKITTINQFMLISNFKYTLLAGMFSIILFSLIGLPPLLGFWGKYLVIVSCFGTWNVFTSSCVFIIIVVTTLIATSCYLKIWKNIFVEMPIYTTVQQRIFSLTPIAIYNNMVLILVSGLLILLPAISCVNNYWLIMQMDCFLLSFF